MASIDPDRPKASDNLKSRTNPVVRNALRLSLSEKEYLALHRFLLRRSPPAVRKYAPTPQDHRRFTHGHDDYNLASIRASIRIFLASQTGLKLWEWVKKRVATRDASRPRQAKTKIPILKSPDFRLSLSLSLIFLLHRLFFRFFSRLRSNLLSRDAAPFRQRNPRISRSLTSRLAPAIGASLAGFALGIYPGDQLRLTIAIFTGVKSVEFLYNSLEADGWFKDRPWWLGSWMLMPVASGQLLHAFVFDRDCFPKAYGDFILEHTPNYVQKRPLSYPPALPWPSTDQIIDSLAEMSRLNWPPFISPILFPNLIVTLPSSLSVLAPITSPASPSHTSLSCATLHPSDPSCTRTLAHYTLTAFPAIAKFFAAFYAIFALPKYRQFIADPSLMLNKLVRQTLKTATFITGAIGTSWASICFFQAFLPRALFSHSRWFWGGFLGGLWAIVDRQRGRSQFLYNVRMSVDSLWKVGRKRGWWRGVNGGDVVVFVVSLALTNAVFERRRGSVDASVGRGIGWLRGEELFSNRLDQKDGSESDKRSS